MKSKALKSEVWPNSGGNFDNCLILKRGVLAFKVQYTKHYHLELQANPKKMYKSPMLFLASMGETGLSHDNFQKNLT